MEDDSALPPGQVPPDSLLPYQDWTDEAQRLVMIRALQYAAREGLPGSHHFYVSFRTAAPGVVVPTRLLAQYPEEMTIVLQHQFWELKVDPQETGFSVGLSFGGVGSILEIPFSAVVAFADPQIQLGMRFNLPDAAADVPAAPGPAAEAMPAEAEAAAEEPPEEPQVVSLDAFRRRATPKD